MINLKKIKHCQIAVVFLCCIPSTSLNKQKHVKYKATFTFKGTTAVCTMFRKRPTEGSTSSMFKKKGGGGVNQ